MATLTLQQLESHLWRVANILRNARSVGTLAIGLMNLSPQGIDDGKFECSEIDSFTDGHGYAYQNVIFDRRALRE